MSVREHLFTSGWESTCTSPQNHYEEEEDPPLDSNCCFSWQRVENATRKIQFKAPKNIINSTVFSVLFSIYC